MLSDNNRLDLANQPIRVLVVEDDAAEIELMRRALRENFASDFDLVTAQSFAEAELILERKGINLVILDLNLPDSHALDTFLRFQDSYSQIPVILLTGQEDEELALRAIRGGAQDFIVKGAIRKDQTIRAMRFAVERHRLLQQTLGKSLTDDLTGLYNRRGFFELAQNQLKLSARNSKELILLYMDLDNMKGINDSFGHDIGDSLLCDMAEILRRSFRETDLCARLGGDEFVVLALGTSPEYAGLIATRLLRNVNEFNAGRERVYNISVSMGISSFDPSTPCSLENMLNRADHAMYMDKRSHKSWLQGKR